MRGACSLHPVSDLWFFRNQIFGALLPQQAGFQRERDSLFAHAATPSAGHCSAMPARILAVHLIFTVIACPSQKSSAPHASILFRDAGMLAQVRKDSGEDAFARGAGAGIDGGNVVGPPPRRVRPRRLHPT